MGGLSSEEVDLPDDVSTVGALAAWLERARPVLAGKLGAVRFAQNEVFVELDAALRGGDIIALIPPVAGG